MTTMVQTSIGKKVVMAATGLILVGFAAGHLAGNLLIFAGPHALNAYAQKLRALPALLWCARIVLLAAVALHARTSIQLSRQNRAARASRYGAYRTAETTWYARTMVVSGLLLLAYVIYHLLHFTFHATDPAVAGFVDRSGHHDVYRMVVHSFQDPVTSLIYVIAMALLFSHLRHGIASTAQTLGLTDERTLAACGRAGALLAWALFLGYSSIPLAVLFGAVR